MDLIADVLLIAAAVGAAFYCFTLSRRLSALTSAEGGVGQAIAALSEQVSRLEDTLEGSRVRAEDIDQRLRATVERAEQLESALSAPPTQSSVTVPRSVTTTTPPRTEAQPASFRRRLFAGASPENEA